MTRNRTRVLLLPLLALCLTFAGSGVASSQTSTSASLQISFGTAPHWVSVGGTGVRRIRDNEGPGYDMFRYGGSYYAYNNDQWYRSRTMRGQYSPIEARNVPRAFSKVPCNHWRHYPSNWSGQNNDGRLGPPGEHKPNDGHDPR